MIYTKNTCRSNEKLIVEKQIYNEQNFSKFERCSVDTLSILLLFFRFNLYCNVYLFFQIFIMKSFRISFSQHFYFVFLTVVLSLLRI